MMLERLTGRSSSRDSPKRQTGLAAPAKPGGLPRQLARQLRPALRSCLSTPLSVDSRLVGVLTLYAQDRDAFSDDHRRLFQMIGILASQILLDTSRSPDDADTSVAQPTA